jgi:flagellar basal body-associated protein FliL
MNEFDDMAANVEGVELPDVDIEGGDDFGMGVGGGGGMSSAVFAIVLVVIIVIEAIGSHFAMKQLLFSKPPDAKKVERAKRDSGEFGEIYTIGGLIVNTTSGRSTKHLLVDIGVQSTSSRVIAEITLRDALIRDNINMFLAAQRYEVLTDIMMRDKLRSRIREIIDYNLSEGEIDKVYFTRFVIQ